MRGNCWALVVVTLVSAGCSNPDLPPCASFQACGGTLPGTDWTFAEACTDPQLAPATLSFSATDNSYSTSSGTKGTYSIAGNLLSLTVGTQTQSSQYCVDGNFLSLLANGNPHDDYVVYKAAKK